ncbi:hypothetical protein GIB67_010812 [Kingdonia uniflora]|uniref:Uncharacterized protein n=1 Tax=Kingdonia uniflora TaxID=39325 RepID=A0A7J7L8X3_9MAGN|nr:hypothetical protein GIB67_010812 [Kingdonia uniflora]
MTKVLTPHYDLNIAAYDNYGKLNLSPLFVLSIGSGFARFTATLTQVALFHGGDILEQSKMAMKSAKVDIHARLMKKYKDVHFKFFEATQTVDDLTQKIEEKDTTISKGQKELVETKEKTTKLKSQNDVLMVKSKEANMARYRIQALETSEKELRHFVASLNDQMISKTNELEKLKNKMIEKDNELKRSRDDLSNSEIVTDLAQANSRIKNAEAGECLRKNKGDARVSIIQGDVFSLSAQIKELEENVARTQGYVQKGNEWLRECQGKLDPALVREQELELVIRGKEILIKKNDYLLRKSPVGVGIERELEELHAQVAKLRTMNRAESDKVDEKARKHINLMSRAESRMEWHEARYKKLQERLQKVKVNFDKAVMPEI